MSKTWIGTIRYINQPPSYLLCLYSSVAAVHFVFFLAMALPVEPRPAHRGVLISREVFEIASRLKIMRTCEPVFFGVCGVVHSFCWHLTSPHHFILIWCTNSAVLRLTSVVFLTPPCCDTRSFVDKFCTFIWYDVWCCHVLQKSLNEWLLIRTFHCEA